MTFLFTAPVGAAWWKITESGSLAAIVAVAFLIGGLMFGPDLDTMSKQYTRWGFLRILWYPYQVFFKHRSRWSHGLIFGTFLRVIYIIGVLTLLSFGATFLFALASNGTLPNLFEFMKTWGMIGKYAHDNFGAEFFPAIFIGLWLGAASHTLTDMAGSFIKHGRIMEFL